MSRRRKTGLDYYYKDVHEWDQIPIVALINRYGPEGYCVYTLTESRIYEMGYYLEISLESLSLYVMRILGLRNQERVIEILNYCADLGLFDSKLMSKSIVTSVSIQKHYASVTARRKVDKSKYWLLDEKNTAKEETEMAPNSPEDYMTLEEVKDYFRQLQFERFLSGSDSAAEMRDNDPETPFSAAEMRDNDAGTPFSAAEMQDNDAGTPFSAAEMHQRKENKSKEKQSKAKHSKAKQTIARERAAAAASLASSFVDDETAENYLAYIDKIGAEELSYPETGHAENPRPSRAYFVVTGNRMRHKDWDALEEMRSYGADDRLIASVILEVGNRSEERGIEIGSMLYFVPIVKETVDKRAKKRQSHGGSSSGRYPGTSDIEEIESLLDEEWAKEVSRYIDGEEINYDDGD